VWKQTVACLKAGRRDVVRYLRADFWQIRTVLKGGRKVQRKHSC
jgi:hypothetical protein